MLRSFRLFGLVKDDCVFIADDCYDTASILCPQESQRQREMVEQRYTKYKEIVWDLQHQLDESKRRIQEYRVRHTHSHTHTHTHTHTADRCDAVL